MATSTNLLEKQIGALKRMLNFNAPLAKSFMSEPQWKVLVYDQFGQNIISPLLSVKELRDMGVTLHLLLDSEREPIQDVPAIYFVMPTDQNIRRICKDFQNQLYESYYLNFISAIPRPKLEDIALAAIQSNAVAQIPKVFDQYMNFITLEDDMFCLSHQTSDQLSYYALNRGDMKDADMNAITDSIADSLFSVFVTLGVVPIIRSPTKDAAEKVAEKLDKKLRENLHNKSGSLFSSDVTQAGQVSFQRPLLVILDRDVDLATQLHHTWTYQALAHDVLDLSLNRVEIQETVDAKTAGRALSQKKKRSYDLNPTDKFWHTHKGSPFPTVAEAVQEELEAYKAQEDEVKRLKQAMGLGDDVSAISMLSDTTAKLTSAVSSLPELLEKKRLIDMHTNIATAILEQIKLRKLDIYFETEEKLMSKSAVDKSLLDIISDPEAGTVEDKLRLFIIRLICGKPMPDSEIDQYSKALEDAGCSNAALLYIRRWRTHTRRIPIESYAGGGTTTVSMFSKLMSQASQFAMEGVKNLVVKKHNLPITKVVDALMDLRTDGDVKDYRYFDPKMLRGNDPNVARTRTPFQEAVVFVVGGGNYIEYQNLVDYVKEKRSLGSTKRITYGCSQLQNASQFLSQLDVLGQNI